MRDTPERLHISGLAQALALEELEIYSNGANPPTQLL